MIEREWMPRGSVMLLLLSLGQGEPGSSSRGSADGFRSLGALMVPSLANHGPVSAGKPRDLRGRNAFGLRRERLGVWRGRVGVSLVFRNELHTAMRQLADCTRHPGRPSVAGQGDSCKMTDHAHADSHARRL
jgi:hypothetical protein